ncbi:MAG: amidase [Vicinamibacterales bacterium]
MDRDRRGFLEAVVGACAAATWQTRAGAAPAPSDLTTLSLTEAAARLRARSVSPVDLTRACLDRIERLNPTLNAFITITGDRALEEARDAEAEIVKGKWRGPLHGVPIALKDIVDTKGLRTTAASELYKARVPDEDAEVVRRLTAAGAVLLGKLNLHEFAYGATSLTSAFGAVHNPWNPSYIAGGSSGGSGAAVSAGLCYGALGTDTGGSIRVPAAFCGIVGLKPTYGRVSTRGVLPLSWSLDHIGPMTRTCADAAAMLQVLAGYDAGDTSSVSRPVPDYAASLRRPTGALRVGVPRDVFYASLHPDIDAAMNRALGVLRTLTADVRDVPVPVRADVRAVVRAAESYAYHASHVAKTPELYQPDVLRKIRAGADVTASAYIDAHREMERMRRAVEATFETVDVLVTPTTPVPPIRITASPDEDDERMRDVSPFNLYGLPAISVPCGFTQEGLPIGLQIVGPAWGEDVVLRLGHAFEHATEWHTRHPSL